MAPLSLGAAKQRAWGGTKTKGKPHGVLSNSQIGPLSSPLSARQFLHSHLRCCSRVEAPPPSNFIRAGPQSRLISLLPILTHSTAGGWGGELSRHNPASFFSLDVDVILELIFAPIRLNE